MPDPILASNIPEEASPTRPLAIVVNDPDGTPEAKLVDLNAQYLTVVQHGYDAAVARPSTAGTVMWVGYVNPTNKAETDVVEILAGGFNPLTELPVLHGMWASDPQWGNPGADALVSAWRNQSGGGDPAASGSARPTFRTSVPALNDRPAVEFGGDDLLFYDIDNVDQPFKVVAVIKATSWPTGSVRAIGGLGGATNNGIGKPGSSATTYTYNPGTALTGGTVDTDAHVIRATADGASSEMWVDESSIVSGDGGANALVYLALGAGYNASGPTIANHFTGHIAFAAFFDGSTDDADLAGLAAELMDYYGIS